MFKVAYCHALEAFLSLMYLHVVVRLCENLGSIFAVGSYVHLHHCMHTGSEANLVSHLSHVSLFPPAPPHILFKSFA
jgi:hypothetical protein